MNPLGIAFIILAIVVPVLIHFIRLAEEIAR
jgi:hypothetical protein